MNYWQYQDQPKRHRSRRNRGDNQRDLPNAPAGESQLSLFDAVFPEQPELAQATEQPTEEEFTNWLDEWEPRH